MVSKFVREQKRYTQRELGAIFECPEEMTVFIIRRLKEFGIVKAVKMSDEQKDMSELADSEIEVADVEPGDGEYLYVFTFVGVIIVSGIVLKCYPKYLLHSDEPREELGQVLKVLEKYNSKEQIVRMFNDGHETSAFNLLAVLLFLMQDYFENGTYSNTEEITESNGTGEILWDRTINETFTLIVNSRPYYTDLQTRKRITDEYDYITRLHQCVLTKVSKELQDADLLDLFEMPAIELSEEQIDDFGDEGYILYRIEQALNLQFNTRKQLLLKTLYAYISHSGNLYDLDCLSLFGTNSFNLVWEEVCSEVMGNQLQTRLRALNLPAPLQKQYDGDQKLIDIIEKPMWTASGRTAQETLIPDLITISCDRFIIFDAKYYTASFERGKPPKGQPGIESVTKQYLYQLAYQSFIDHHGFSGVVNCFLLPTETDKVIDKGEVVMEMFSSLGLQDIKVRLLPTGRVYDNYLSGTKMDVNQLNL